ncbi:DinB family protein [Paenibacillus piri]|uniref:DinB family protein n=1 Tax=Paenibacillus piri TaxID=2547395 RepID=A0A4R5KB15_9BACL|nr:DinB family protein [Paenibacillus piri]TDF91327.1 DinB family protein [Paenibacillus piri]
MDQVLEARNALWKSVDGLPDELLRRQDCNGWSILDVLEHLFLVEQVALRVIKDALSKPPFTEQIRVNPLEPVLDRADKLDAPDPIYPKGLFKNLDEARNQLDQSRELLLSFISSVDVDVLRIHGAPHPRYGLLSAEQWAQFVGVHERRHIIQIEEMKHV